MPIYTGGHCNRAQQIKKKLEIPCRSVTIKIYNTRAVRLKARKYILIVVVLLVVGIGYLFARSKEEQKFYSIDEYKELFSKENSGEN